MSDLDCRADALDIPGAKYLQFGSERGRCDDLAFKVRGSANINKFFYAADSKFFVAREAFCYLR